MGEIFWPRIMETSTITNSAAQAAPPIENLVKFCLLWTVLQVCLHLISCLFTFTEFVYIYLVTSWVFLQICLHLYWICLLLQRTKPPQACNEVLKMRDFTENQIQLDHMLRNLKNNGLYQNWKLRSPHDNILTPNERDQMNAFQFHYQHTSRSLSVIG